MLQRLHGRCNIHSVHSSFTPHVGKFCTYTVLFSGCLYPEWGYQTHDLQFWCMWNWPGYIQMRFPDLQATPYGHCQICCDCNFKKVNVTGFLYGTTSTSDTAIKKSLSFWFYKSLPGGSTCSTRSIETRKSTFWNLVCAWYKKKTN